MITHPSSVNLNAGSKTEIISLLNLLLADLSDLHSQAKQAHWNVRGPRFLMLHELFDKVAESAEEPIDALAERIATLGGIVQGTLKQSARSSRLSDFPAESGDGAAFLQAVTERYAIVSNTFREAVETTGRLGDTVTSDQLTEVTAGLDKALWFLEAHRGD